MFSGSDMVLYRDIQIKLSEKIVLRDAIPFKDIKLIGGADVSYRKKGDRIFGSGCLVVMDFRNMEVVEKVTGTYEVKFPYIPGYLAFREVPVIIKLLDKLKLIPDVFLLDGQGIAHPRRAGLAVHFGVVSKHPAIGCAKNWLYGEYRVPSKAGEFTYLMNGEDKIGGVIKPLRGKRMLFVSPGNLVSVDTSIKIVMSCLHGHRLPEPLRIAHNELKQIS